MDLVVIGAVLYLVNTILSLIFALTIIDKLYISKKFSKEKHFHFYNDLFSWELFYFFIAFENMVKILTLLLPLNDQISNLILRIRILIFFMPFWNKVIHLEKVMDKITYERHYLAGLIPMILILAIGFTNLPNIILIILFFSTTFSPFLIFFIFFKNSGTTIKKTSKIIFGAVFIGLGYIFRPEILDGYVGISETLDLLIMLTNISAPISFILGTLLIFDSFRKELKHSEE